mmetsp:Transcript_6439/g.7215  ORF Transcript_6439/g.7215 Transcript_6439/m.7215 type:complete len:135 (+) Transcript_6439:220-624(+)
MVIQTACFRYYASFASRNKTINHTTIRQLSVKKRKTGISKTKSKKLRNTIAAVKKADNLNVGNNAKKGPNLLENVKNEHIQNVDTKESSNDILNAFLIVGVFPVVATGTLICFNDEMKADFMKRFGFEEKNSSN